VSYPIPKCPTCKQCLPESAKALVAARVKGPISPGRNDAASRNSFVTDIMAAGDPNTVGATGKAVRYTTASGEIAPHVNLDERDNRHSPMPVFEPDRFDADWDGGVK